MALEENGNNGLVMPVAPMYGGGGFGNGGFGGDWGWIILLLLLAGGNGWGGGFGGGFGNAQLGYDFPWLLNGQNNINANTNNGFRDAMINDGITSIRDGIGNLSTQLCGCCGDIQMALANGFSGVEQGANARQMANMQSIFGVQTALQNCCCENRANIADLKYTVATENCADRQVVSDGIRDVIESNSRNTQLILDKLCQQELDNLKQANVSLQNQLNMATLRESQTAQNALITKGFSDEVDALYTRLSNCPVPTTPVYGRTPIFTCNNNGGCGCGCGNF
jgi:hypothetical protein